MYASLLVPSIRQIFAEMEKQLITKKGEKAIQTLLWYFIIYEINIFIIHFLSMMTKILLKKYN